jgi:hypothetical protein
MMEKRGTIKICSLLIVNKGRVLLDKFSLIVSASLERCNSFKEKLGGNLFFVNK